METIAVIDFETTGLSPSYGDRATEIAAVLVRDGQIVDLGTLVEFAKLPMTGRYHRAQADAEMTAHLILYLERELMRRFGIAAVSCQLLAKIQKTAANRLEHCVARFAGECP